MTTQQQPEQAPMATRGALNRENLGTGVVDPMRWRKFLPDKGNLEPGQENTPHVHPNRAHVMIILTGTGEYFRIDSEAVPVRAGDYIIVPRDVPHGIRNTGVDRLSYANISNNNQTSYQRTAVERQS